MPKTISLTINCCGDCPLNYSCSNCGRGIGEFSAMRALELYGVIMCGKCLHEMMEARREEEEEKQEA